MKKQILISVMLSLTLAACGGGGGGGASSTAPTPPSTAVTPPPVISKVDTTKFTLCQNSTCNTDLVSKFNVDQFFFSAAQIHDETILPMAGNDNYPLWRNAASIQQVRNRYTGQVYVDGVDYTIVAGALQITTASNIPKILNDFIHPAQTTTPYYWSPFVSDGSILHIGGDYQGRQIAVTYTPSLVTFQPLVKGTTSKLKAKLDSGQQVAITYIGDSITVGLDTSSDAGAGPKQPSYPFLASAYLAKKYPNQVYIRNLAVSGTTTADGVTNEATLVGDTFVDAIVINYGTNDAFTKISTAAYQANLTSIVNAAKAKNPDVEIVLLVPFAANPDWKGVSPNSQQFKDFAAVCNTLADTTPNVSVSNMLEVGFDMMQHKAYYDVTANGITHPNDFIHVMYAQVLLKTFLNL
jgi:lysophospholipase L1-like esterase